MRVECGWLVLCTGIPVPPLQTGDAHANQFEGYSKSGLQTSDTTFQAVRCFSKSKAERLPVYENGELQGTISLISITRTMLREYSAERNKRFQLVVKMNSKIVKLQHLMDVIVGQRKPKKYSPEALNDTLKDIIEILNTTT